MILEFIVPFVDKAAAEKFDRLHGMNGELIRCHDCVYFATHVHDRGDDSRCVWYNRETRADDFCSSAERKCKEDE